ncbi:hypothetical protein ASG92_26900 [Arthrobacter sp. Soil736]|nr:hypothetical protein ASG92_26900 [Arthrobacter sp. Soil736]
MAGDGSGVAQLSAVVPGEVHAQGGPEAVGVYGDADKALLRPEAQGVSDEAEQVCGGFDGERFHGLSFFDPFLGLTVVVGMWVPF